MTDTDSLLGEMRRRMSEEKITSCMVIRQGISIFTYDKSKRLAGKLYKINSCTKSVLSAVVGVALDQGLIPSVQTPIAEYFPSLTSASDARKRAITIEHLLTMTAGFDWPEFGEWDYFPRMIYSPHWVRFVLERPLAHNPGERMTYNSGCSHLLTAIVQQVTGMTAAAYAREHLFGPLGISDFIWHEDRQGVTIGGFGLSLSTADMAKFGLLYLQQGRWGARHVVPREWVAVSTRPRYLTYEGIGHYGQHWWVSTLTSDSAGMDDDNRFYFALGYGGQFIIVVPSRDLIVVMTSELYNQSLRPMHYFRQYIVPSLHA